MFPNDFTSPRYRLLVLDTVKTCGPHFSSKISTISKETNIHYNFLD